jgi:hypothetical protein
MPKLSHTHNRTSFMKFYQINDSYFERGSVCDTLQRNSTLPSKLNYGDSGGTDGGEYIV